MLFSPTLQQNMGIDMLYNAGEDTIDHLTESEQVSSTFTPQIYQFEIGPSLYRLVRPVNINFSPSDEGWMCYINELANYVGFGETRQKAFEDLKIKIHSDFQRLLRKRPFEMDDDERLNWSQLTNTIDLLSYKTETPVMVREIGCVSHQRLSRPARIKWLSGKNYMIDPNKVPGELMSCGPGQWIEAVVKRDPISHRELEIESINRISFRIPTDKEIKEYWGNLPEADLEPTDGTW